MFRSLFVLGIIACVLLVVVGVSGCEAPRRPYHVFHPVTTSERADNGH